MWKKTGVSGMIRKCLFCVILINVLILAVLGGRFYLFGRPARLEAECRGRGIDVEVLKGWEERGAPEILDLAGWRIRERVMVLGESTKRSQEAQVLEVYGNMELAMPAHILAGTYGMAGREDICVLTGELADALFGGVDVVGEQVCCQQEDMGSGLGSGQGDKAAAANTGSPQGEQGTAKGGRKKRIMTVAGVIDKEGQCLLTFTQYGELHMVAVRFQERFQIRERMRELLSFASARSCTSYRRSGN